MKKMIKVLLGGLGISVVLAALSPNLFLEDDAKWTFQGNVGRVDVAFTGDVENGCLEVLGNNVRVYEPKWLLDNRHNQGAMVSFPVSYLKKTYKITLLPRGDAREMSLEMNFRGPDLRIHNQRKPAYVCFENIRVNGKTVAEEQTVWHDKPFRYSAENISDNSTVTLSFGIRKPISFEDIVWNRLVGLFIACSLLPFCSDILRGLVNGLNKKDIVQVITDSYRSIDVVYRRAFWIIFGVLCFAFGFHAISFMWGNHDWDFVGGFISLPWDGRAFEGRYAVYLLKKLFLGDVYLPLIYDVIAFLSLALNAVLLCTYWKLEKRVIYFVLCGLILTVQPFTLSVMYYVHMLPEAFIGVTFALTALMLGEKIAFDKSSHTRKVAFFLLSIVLINLSLAMYPVLLNTIAVAFVGRLLVQSFHWDGSWNQFKAQFTPFSVSAICVALGIVLYKGMVTFVFPLNKDVYNTQTLPFEQLPERLWTLFKQCFHQLYEYPFPFISQGILWVFLGFTILIALHIYLTGNVKQKIVRLILLGGALFSTQTAMIVADQHVIADRIELFGLVVFEMLVAVLIFTELKKLHNLNILAAIGVVWVSIVNDLDCLRVWKLGFDAEKMLWNRVLARLETQKGFDINHKYKVVNIGSLMPMRPRYATNSTFGQGFSLPLVSFSYNLHPFDLITFYAPINFVSLKVWLRGNKMLTDLETGYKIELKRLWEAGILDKAQVWPHENGLIVWKDVILIVTDVEMLEKYKRQLANEFPRQPKQKP